ncbi:hypothetical protein OPV22_033472 [Ensete ventricosum]|uniref:Uncharacterized protein n=1 Tax=Ensete ventricosum TaxID=4639 RepID=A0AAV8PPW7_ENSVE|nr:hypothetical protein OPV22_033472 [Ensete ventricosum]
MDHTSGMMDGARNRTVFVDSVDKWLRSIHTGNLTFPTRKKKQKNPSHRCCWDLKIDPPRPVTMEMGGTLISGHEPSRCLTGDSPWTKLCAALIPCSLYLDSGVGVLSLKGLQFLRIPRIKLLG